MIDRILAWPIERMDRNPYLVLMASIPLWVDYVASFF